MAKRKKPAATKKKPALTAEFFRQQGAIGGKIGGKRLAEKLTPEQKSANAKRAVAARKWHAPLTPAEKAKRAKAKAKAKRPVGRPRKKPEV